MTALPETVAGFDLAAAIRLYHEHLASADYRLAALRLPSGDWLTLADVAPEPRGDAEGSAA